MNAKFLQEEAEGLPRRDDNIGGCKIYRLLQKFCREMVQQERVKELVY